MKFYRHVPTQIVIVLLFQVLIFVSFRFTSLTLLGAYILGCVFCLLWGNIGYLVLSDAVFCLITVWLCRVGNFSMGIDLCFWYLLFTFLPGILIVHLRNVLASRFASPTNKKPAI